VDDKTTTARSQEEVTLARLQTMGSGDLNGESTTIKRREVARQEVGNNIRTGEHSSVCLFTFSSYNVLLIETAGGRWSPFVENFDDSRRDDRVDGKDDSDGRTVEKKRDDLRFTSG
jgi:hypothetical protein